MTTSALAGRRWIDFLSLWTFPSRSRPQVLKALEVAGSNVEVLHLTQRSQTRELLERLHTGGQR